MQDTTLKFFLEAIHKKVCISISVSFIQYYKSPFYSRLLCDLVSPYFTHTLIFAQLFKANRIFGEIDEVNEEFVLLFDADGREFKVTVDDDSSSTRS
ncbi:hypothetical protein VNO80_26464 [Phaseolus coccineus]|uniref:Uncharacterized protein n=1 Tax=Phaseolus coccineus TaxID=3886 RepID=A0AAN9LJT7_PHACN